MAVAMVDNSHGCLNPSPFGKQQPTTSKFLENTRNRARNTARGAVGSLKRGILLSVQGHAAHAHLLRVGSGSGNRRCGFQIVQITQTVQVGSIVCPAVPFANQVFSVAFLILAAVVFALWPTGYFGPLSSRIRGLFVKHTRTGILLCWSLFPHRTLHLSALKAFSVDATPAVRARA